MRALNLIAIWCLLVIGAAVRADDFDAANQLYDQGKFAEAKAAYERLVKRGEWSANLFYNLGNAAFRTSAPGEALLNYERALALDATHAEAKANAKWLREQTGGRVAPRTWWQQAVPRLSGDIFAVLATLGFWVGVFAIIGVMAGRRYWGWGIFSLLVAAYAGVGLWLSERESTAAVITGKAVSARLAPADRAALAEPLPEGSRVFVLSERGEWIYCELPGGGRGWIPQNQLEKIRLTKS